MSPEMANVIVRKAQLAAGITSLTPHDCRRTFATLLFEAGADLLLVQSLMGHASADTTKRYDKRQESHKREAAQLLNLKGVS
jgi:integrase